MSVTSQSAKSSSEPWCHAKGPRSTGCRRFTIADALLLLGAFALALGLQKAQGYPWIEFLWNPRKLLIANIAELIFGNFNLTFSLLWSLGAALVLVRSRSPRPSYSLVMRQPGAVACWTTTIIGLLSCIAPTVGYLVHLRGSVLTWEQFLGTVCDPFTLNLSLGYAVAAAWIALFLSGRWRCERGWIDALGVVVIGSASIATCAIFNFQCT